MNPRICLLSLLIALATSQCLVSGVGAQSDCYQLDYEWTYKGKEYTLSLNISRAWYQAYQNVSVFARTRYGVAGYGFLTTTNDPYVKFVAENLNETALKENYEPVDQVSFALAFVQSLPYTSDNVTSGFDEYPRFPVETLMDNGGDCEDTSILFATLTLIMGYGTVYVNPPDHCAVGVLGDGLVGSYYTYKNKTYYYCETTGTGWEIGQIPPQFEDSNAYIYDIYYQLQYVPDIPVP
ncbi:MAG TPA: hypothetical protein VF893_04565, partial [Candidatus Bathyarchaeia archaeon]